MRDPEDDDSVEIQPVERRSMPRAPARGLEVEGIDRGPIAGKRIPVGEVSVESFFLPGPEALQCVVGRQYRLRLHHGPKQEECTAECVRTESSPRTGAVLRLLPDEERARGLLAEILRPSTVPVRTE